MVQIIAQNAKISMMECMMMNKFVVGLGIFIVAFVGLASQVWAHGKYDMPVVDGFQIISSAPMYETVIIYGEETVCVKGDDKTTEGAIVGGLIGSENGNAGIGALIGAIIGDQIGQEKCETRKVKTGERQILKGWNIVVMSPDGGKFYFFVPAKG